MFAGKIRLKFQKRKQEAGKQRVGSLCCHQMEQGNLSGEAAVLGIATSRQTVEQDKQDVIGHRSQISTCDRNLSNLSNLIVSNLIIT